MRKDFHCKINISTFMEDNGLMDLSLVCNSSHNPLSQGNCYFYEKDNMSDACAHDGFMDGIMQCLNMDCRARALKEAGNKLQLAWTKHNMEIEMRKIYPIKHIEIDDEMMPELVIDGQPVEKKKASKSSKKSESIPEETVEEKSVKVYSYKNRGCGMTTCDMCDIEICNTEWDFGCFRSGSWKICSKCETTRCPDHRNHGKERDKCECGYCDECNDNPCGKF